MTKRKQEYEDTAADFRIEPAVGSQPRIFVAQAGRLSVRLPINPGVPVHSAKVILRREMARRLYDLLDALTAPKQ